MKKHRIPNKLNLKRSAALLGVSLAMVSGVMAQDTIAEREKKAEHLQAMYNMAERAYKDGDINAARQTLRALLAEKPSYGQAIALQRQLQLNGDRMVLAKKKRVFNAVILEQVDYKELTLAQAIKLLGSSVETSSKGKVVPNFVIQDPKRYLGNESIDLQLKNIPAGTVLEHLMKETGCTATFTTYTISIKPRANMFKNALKNQDKNEDENSPEESKEGSSDE